MATGIEVGSPQPLKLTVFFDRAFIARADGFPQMAQYEMIALSCGMVGRMPSMAALAANRPPLSARRKCRLVSHRLLAL